MTRSAGELFEAVPSPYLVPTDGSFRLSETATAPPGDAGESKRLKRRLARRVEELDRLQRRLYADDRHAILLVFQAMDAAGKDGTIRAVLSGVNPAGCQVHYFKQPTHEELDHDFLWRTARDLPERGRIGVFNRSYYEEVLVVRVHPEFLSGQRLPRLTPDVWNERYESIVDHEKHLARNGTVILKFWLNVSADEQRRRFIARIDDPDKNWKFSEDDVRKRALWGGYMEAYEQALRATSRPWAPWYAVPADSKPWARLVVADIVVRALESLDLSYPELDPPAVARLAELRDELSGS